MRSVDSGFSQFEAPLPPARLPSLQRSSGRRKRTEVTFKIFNNGAEVGAQLSRKHPRAASGRPSAVWEGRGLGWMSGGSRGWSSGPPAPQPGGDFSLSPPAPPRCQPRVERRAGLPHLDLCDRHRGPWSPQEVCPGQRCSLAFPRNRQWERGRGEAAQGRGPLPSQAGHRGASCGEAARSLSLLSHPRNHTEDGQ